MNLINKPQYNSLIFMDSNINLLKLNSSKLSAEVLDTCHANGFIISNLKASFLLSNFTILPFCKTLSLFIFLY